MAQPLLLLVCGALLVAGGRRGPSDAPGGTGEPADAPTAAPTEDETLQNEADNQENVLSQLLGDYDKVKAVSEGSDCQCKCVVRPLGRDACQRVNEGTSRKDDFYTVETITSGSSCKCACVAPPSALNPCEGDFRLQKLRAADSRDLKLSTIIDMLEGAFYGLDLLKLHSVTTKLVGRMDKLEEEVSKNLTKENEQIKEDMEEIRTEMSKRGKENCSESILDGMPDVRAALQRDAAAAYAPPEYEERFLQEETVSQQINSIELVQTRPLAPPEVVRPQRPLQRQVHLRGRPASRPTVIRGVTYYKAKDPEEENDIEEQQDEFFSGDNGVDLLIEDQLLRHNDLLTTATRRPAATRQGTPGMSVTQTSAQATPSDPSTPGPTLSASVEQVSAPPHTSSVVPGPTTEVGPEPSTQVPATTVARSATQQPSASASLLGASGGAFTEAPPTAPVPPTTVRTDSLERDVATGQGTAPASPTLSPEEEDDIRNVIGRCKDTLSTITGPTTQNTYGRNEGAWMKDPLAKDERIYVTNYYYGNTLVEFRNLENFKQGRWSNSYKLPYSWIGTGHVVYAGAFYYSRAFTRNIIKYDLKQRFVAAWAMLHDVAYEEATPWRWQGHSDVDFAVDENGLWLIYPALDDEGFSQEVIVLSKLNAADLSTQKETTWRTGLRRHLYGNCFVICGVLYAVDSHNQRNANISYAFDTHTNTQIVPRLLFENEYSYTTQIDYNPKDRLLYAWDNGHQVTYHVIFAY
ncbi:olfactomedin-like protein 2B isoform X1 [Canis lupus baileyi]|uniref:olfactomedin-like protein 2B isoform X1 n=1 Tax=Canis lupus baileyi TaxID=143281 RepID=UPI003B96CB4D